jgi:hypothetical protein
MAQFLPQIFNSLRITLALQNLTFVRQAEFRLRSENAGKMILSHPVLRDNPL